MTDELISVVITTYNRAKTLQRSIESVLSQSHRNLELIVVDDASTDNSGDVISGIDDPRLRVIRHEQNKGFAAALNTGARAANGDYIAFQDSDDEWLSGKLARQLEAMKNAAPDCVCVYCIKIVYGRDSKRIYGNRRIVCVPGPEIRRVSGNLRDSLRQKNIVSTQTILCRTSAYLQTGGFDEVLKNNVDWDFVSRLSELGSFEFIDEPLVNTYIQNDSISTFSKDGTYSQLRIVNKMRRRGVPIKDLTRILTRLGYKLGKSGNSKRGHILLKYSLKQEPANPRIWLRFLANYLRRLT